MKFAIFLSEMAMIRELGVGLRYHSALADFVASSGEAIDVLEIDSSPWLDRHDEDELSRLARIPCAKLLRGCPVGASRLPEPGVLPRLRELASALEAPWITGELAFHRAHRLEGSGAKGEDFDTGLLLPLRQTVGGARLAAHSARSVGNEVRAPFALRGVRNYLKPRRDEISDGEFLAEVAEDAECGIVLDLGSLWINAANGRCPVARFLDEIPLERVWDLRLGSASQRTGYGFGVRPGEILEPLAEIAAALVPRLPNLRAILFEIHPDSVARLGASGLVEQIRVLRSLWEDRRNPLGASSRTRHRSSRWRHERSIAPREWEDTLGGLVVGKDVRGPLAEELLRDPGLAAARQLLSDSRASMVAKHLALTSRLVVAAAGPAFFRSLLEAYWRREAPSPSAPLEALRFGRHLSTLALDIPYFSEVLEYERAVIASRLDGEKRVVSFRHDPEVVLRALAKGRLPGDPSRGIFGVEVASA
jgi:uncharacterized protein (UPF0276 family)